MGHRHCHDGCGTFEKLHYSRRELLGRLGGGVAGLAFADLLGRQGLLSTPLSAQQAATGAPKNLLAAKEPHFPARAKAVISVFCYGGVSQIDTFDPKPDLMKWQGEPMQGVGQVRTIMGNPGGLMPSPWSFKKYGQSGMDVSELFPHIAQQVDDIAFIRSMNATSPAHGPALFQMNTGSILAGHPSVGSWVTYGLGTENENLPGFIVFTDYRGGPINGPPNWSNGFLPAAYQGTQFRDRGAPIVDLKPAAPRTPDQQREWLRFVHELNEKHADLNPLDTELSARVQSYELAYRMQTHAPEAIDISKETDATKKLYGVGEEPTDYFGRQALMARRLSIRLTPLSGTVERFYAFVDCKKRIVADGLGEARWSGDVDDDEITLRVRVFAVGRAKYRLSVDLPGVADDQNLELWTDDGYGEVELKI